MGREKKKFREGGIGQGENISDHIFLKFSGGGYAWGITKKLGGGCGQGNKKYRWKIFLR